jgi:hypothetical protein
MPRRDRISEKALKDALREILNRVCKPLTPEEARAIKARSRRLVCAAADY